jgi:hypothetical protein
VNPSDPQLILAFQDLSRFLPACQIGKYFSKKQLLNLPLIAFSGWPDGMKLTTAAAFFSP